MKSALCKAACLFFVLACAALKANGVGSEIDVKPCTLHKGTRKLAHKDDEVAFAGAAGKVRGAVSVGGWGGTTAHHK